MIAAQQQLSAVNDFELTSCSVKWELLCMPACQNQTNLYLVVAQRVVGCGHRGSVSNCAIRAGLQG